VSNQKKGGPSSSSDILETRLYKCWSWQIGSAFSWRFPLLSDHIYDKATYLWLFSKIASTVSISNLFQLLSTIFISGMPPFAVLMSKNRVETQDIHQSRSRILVQYVLADTGPDPSG